MRCSALLSWLQPGGKPKGIDERPAFSKRETMQMGPLTVSPMVGHANLCLSS